MTGQWRKEFDERTMKLAHILALLRSLENCKPYGLTQSELTETLKALQKLREGKP